MNVQKELRANTLQARLQPLFVNRQKRGIRGVLMLLIAGGTGFIGGHLVESLGKSGHKVRCLMRSPGKSRVCKSAGFEAAPGDITDRESLKGKLDGCDSVVHLAGIIEEKGDATFERVHAEGTRNLVDEAQEAQVKYFFYQSALGASAAAQAQYLKTKAEAEEIVKTSGIPYTIFRPSLVAGEGDGFTERLKELINIGPVVPIPGDGATKFQPMYVGDWIRCFMAIFSDLSRVARHASRTYELGGPEHLTYNEIIARLMKAMGVNKPVMHIPLEIIKLSLPLSAISRGIGSLFGKKIPAVTHEQLELLQMDNICDKNSVEKAFGFVPMTYSEALKLFIKSNG